MKVVLLLLGLLAAGLVPLAPAQAAASITISRGVVIGGESITVKGALGTKKARQVLLQRKSGKRWVNVISKRSNRAGRYVFTYKPPRKSPSSTVIRVLAPKVKIGRKTYRPVVSGGRTVRTVGQGVTISVPSTQHRDEPFTITGRFTPARSGRPVYLQKPFGNTWVAVGSPVKQNAAGEVSFPMELNEQGFYDYRLLAVAWRGAGAVASATQQIQITAPLGAPAMPTGVVAQAGDGNAQLSWNAVSAPDLAGYLVYRRTSTNEPWVKITPDPISQTSYTATPLTNGLTFQFSVTAIDTDGNESDRSATVTATPSQPVDNTPPPVPTGVGVVPGNASAQVSWNAVSAGDLDGYLVYRALSASGPWTKLTPSPISATTYSAVGLSNGTQYFFAVSSVDTSPAANESNRSTPVAATPAAGADTTPPPVPSGLGASGGNASAQLTWNAVAAGDLAGYRVYQGTNAAGPWTELTTTPITATTYSATGLTNGTEYFFAVSSEDTSANESAKSTAASATPAAGAQTWDAVSSGAAHTCAKRSDGTLWCWGYNSDGQLGSNANITSPSPTQVGSSTDWASVSAGQDSTCGVQSNHTLWCWGSNKYGQLGNATNSGTNTANPTPLQVAGTTWATVSVGYRFACATRTDNTLWCWGSNIDGQLGRTTSGGVLDPHPTPGQVGSASNWSSVSTGTDHACAINASAKLWCWGGNLSGQLGKAANAIANPTPAQVGTDNWTSVSAGDYHSCGVQSGGTVWCWGSNAYGELGKAANSTENPTPSQVAGTGWSSVSAGGDHTCAVKTAGTAWCWGRNQSGQLAQSANETANAAPAQVGSATTWTDISAGYQHTSGRTSTGNIFGWGYNEFGQTGDPLTVGTAPHPTPVLVAVP